MNTSKVTPPPGFFGLPRNQQRASLNERFLSLAQGEDVWNGYELSWLDARGKPLVARARFVFDCRSPNLIESKSFKLYLNSFNDHRFDSPEAVTAVLIKDLSAVSGAPVGVKVVLPETWTEEKIRSPCGEGLDGQPIAIDCYTYHPGFLRTASFEEVLGTLPRVALASVCAYLLGEFCNAYVIAKLKILTAGKYFWFRLIASSSCSIAVDSIVFCSIAFGANADVSIYKIALAQYVAKLAYVVLAMPLTYVFTGFLKKLDQIDWYDHGTNFNPLALFSSR